MGGSGGGYFPKPRRLQELINQAQETGESQKLDADVNALLQQVLARANERSPEQTGRYLEELRKAVGDGIEVKQ